MRSAGSRRCSLSRSCGGQSVVTFQRIEEHGAPWDMYVVWALFFIGGSVCFLGSTLFHLLQCHSIEVFFLSRVANHGLTSRSQAYHLTIKFDYMGIFINIVGSVVCAVHFGFYCHPWARHMYQACVDFRWVPSGPVLIAGCRFASSSLA